MLIGQYENRISDKHQLSLPKKFRDILGDRLILTKGFEKCLIIVSSQNWKTLLEGTDHRPFTDKNTREIQRFLLGNACYVDLDSKGRFVLPQFLRSFAQIQEDIVFAGLDKFVELWDKTQWDKHQISLSQSIETIAQKLSATDEKV